MNTSIQISHRQIARQIHASVALQTLMHPDIKIPPILTSDNTALNSSITASVLKAAALLGKNMVKIHQEESESIIEVSHGGTPLRILLEQITATYTLIECFAATSKTLSDTYRDVLATLREHAQATSVPESLRIRPSAI